MIDGSVPKEGLFYPNWRVTTLGDLDLLIEFSEEIGEEVSRIVHAAARHLACLCSPFGVEIVPAYTSVAVIHRPNGQGRSERHFDELRAAVDAILRNGLTISQESRNVMEVPVCYGGDYGPDLEEVARACSVSPSELVDMHTRKPQLVFMLGFAPGQPVIGLGDTRLNVPRRKTPRLEVAAQSVAVANRQTVIYSFALPGGWHLIGRTPIKPFSLAREPICIFRPGERVRFHAISAEEFEAMEAGNGR